MLSIPKTVSFNLRYLPFNQALKLPVWISYDTKILITGGGVKLPALVKFAMIRIGFHHVPICDKNDTTSIHISNKGRLLFMGTAHIGHGTKIHIAKTAELVLGDNFAVSASSQINCYKHIVFGKDIQFSWDCLTMDSDTHSIYDENGILINEAREIVFGDKIWIGCRSTVLKGSIVPDNCVIGACSVVSGSKFEKNSIIVGNPAKSIKRIKEWKI